MNPGVAESGAETPFTESISEILARVVELFCRKGAGRPWINENSFADCAAHNKHLCNSEVNCELDNILNAQILMVMAGKMLVQRHNPK